MFTKVKDINERTHCINLNQIVEMIETKNIHGVPSLIIKFTFGEPLELLKYNIDDILNNKIID